MAKIRVQDLARMTGIPEQDLVFKLRSLGVRARGTDDGLAVIGVPARLRGGRMSSRGDHRLAMLGAVAGLASRESVRIEDAEAVGVSFPGFFEMIDELRRTSVVVEDERR